MDYWNNLVAFLSQRLDAFGVSAADVPVPLVILALLLPLLLTALARQPLAFFSVLLVVCGLVAVDPATPQAGVLVAIGAYIASILIGVIAIQWTIRNRRINGEMARLRASVEHLRRIVEEQTAAQTKPAPAPEAAVIAPAPMASTPAATATTAAAPAIIGARVEPPASTKAPSAIAAPVVEPATATPGDVAAVRNEPPVAARTIETPNPDEPPHVRPATPDARPSDDSPATSGAEVTRHEDARPAEPTTIEPPTERDRV